MTTATEPSITSPGAALARARAGRPRRHVHDLRPQPLEDLRAGGTQARDPADRRIEPGLPQADRLDDRRPRRLVRRRARRGLRRHGPVRQRQVDAHALPHPAHRADAARSCSTARTSGRPTQAKLRELRRQRFSDGLPALRPAAPPQGHRQRRLRPRDPRRVARRDGCAGAREMLDLVGLERPRRTATPTSSRAACSSASAWPGRSRSTPR